MNNKKFTEKSVNFYDDKKKRKIEENSEEDELEEKGEEEKGKGDLEKKEQKSEEYPVLSVIKNMEIGYKYQALKMILKETNWGKKVALILNGENNGKLLYKNHILYLPKSYATFPKYESMQAKFKLSKDNIINVTLTRLEKDVKTGISFPHFKFEVIPRRSGCCFSSRAKCSINTE
jgi:hypothetical protein